MIITESYRRHGCENKDRFPSEARASAAAQKWCDKDGVVMTVYHCPLCTYWHLSSKLGNYGVAASSIVMPKHGTLFSVKGNA